MSLRDHLASGRPMLMEPRAARALALEMSNRRALALRRPGAMSTVLRAVGLVRPAASEDDDDVGPGRPEAYAPLWAQQAYGEPQADGFGWSLYRGVAMMNIDSALSDRGECWWGWWFHGYDTVLASLKEAFAHPQVKAIFIRVFSPGGVVAGGLAELSAWLRANRAAAGGKPIWFYCDLSASAAYWFTANGDQVWAPKVGLVGSIGTIITHWNYAGMLEQDGIEVTAIEYPIGKSDGAMWKGLSAEATADLTAEIRQCSENFFAEVYLGRPNLTPERVLAFGARVFMGEHADPTRSAVNLGLIDAIGGEQEAFEALLATIPEPEPAESPGFPLNPAA